ncbi:sugar phosphate isomerase/epimerase family protein [Candidatus Poribacteria bacterium]
MKTRTGNFPIGFISGGLGRDAQNVIAWAKENDLEVIDGIPPDQVKEAQAAGLRIGTLGLRGTRELLSADQAKRKAAVGACAEYIRANAALGPLNYMVVMIPENPGLPRAENFGYMVESYGELIPALEESDARISIEGWPGPGALCCTPEALRALFKEIPSKAMGINYDPSHLTRMGIDHVQFLREFVDRVVHMHGKDTELLTDNYYEFGIEQPPTFARPVAYGGMHWRYTIPGHGVVHWVEVFRLLESAGYSGCVSIELEDANFTNSPEERKIGILQGARFLTGC